MKEFIISASQDETKAIKYCQRLLPNAGTAFLHKMLRKKNITRNGKKLDGSDVLHTGDVLRFYFSDETFEKFAGADLKLASAASKLAGADYGLTEADRNRERSGNGQMSAGDLGVQTVLQFAPHGLKAEHIIYEDDDVLFYNKPAGMLSQKAARDDVSLNEYFLQYLLDEEKLTTEELQSFKPSVCNRLDRNTSGLVICGKSHIGLSGMNTMLKERSLQKYYRSIAVGEITETISVKGYLKKDEKTNQVTVRETPFEGASYIETEIVPLKVSSGYSLLEIHLITGKPHQIRAHLSYLGHPIIGDGKYGSPGINREMRAKFRLRSQLLHAYRIVFPADAKPERLAGREFIAPLPALFRQISDDIFH